MNVVQKETLLLYQSSVVISVHLNSENIDLYTDARNKLK